jgi:hypothetical protein
VCCMQPTTAYEGVFAPPAAQAEPVRCTRMKSESVPKSWNIIVGFCSKCKTCVEQTMAPSDVQERTAAVPRVQGLHGEQERRVCVACGQSLFAKAFSRHQQLKPSPCVIANSICHCARANSSELAVLQQVQGLRGAE